jgi:PucR family transcriptional regulator, purine catabolism regulatory protein
MFSYFSQSKTTKNLFQRIDDELYYSEDVIYDDKPIYRVVFMAKNDKRHLLHNYIEIFKLMIIVIHQKKIENTLKQNQFLLNFVSNLSSNYTNLQLVEATKRYNWNVVFPITLVLFSIKENDRSTINPNLVEYTRTVIINKFHLNSDELRYTLLNNQLLFIINTLETINISETLKNIYDTLKIKYRDLVIKITYSNLITDAAQISKTYFQLSEALVHIENNNLTVNIFTEDNIKLLNLLKNIDYVHLKEYVHSKLDHIIDYEAKNNTSLIDTLYKHIECRFNAKDTAEQLIIHYNTVRYRLGVIKDLGINVLENDSGHFDLYFALYLYKNFELLKR